MKDKIAESIIVVVVCLISWAVMPKVWEWYSTGLGLHVHGEPQDVNDALWILIPLGVALLIMIWRK